MDWEAIAYTGVRARDGQRLVRDTRPRPKRVRWTYHALRRAYERAGFEPRECQEWFLKTAYLGRWAMDEFWGDGTYATAESATGVRNSS